MSSSAIEALPAHIDLTRRSSSLDLEELMDILPPRRRAAHHPPRFPTPHNLSQASNASSGNAVDDAIMVLDSDDEGHDEQQQQQPRTQVAPSVLRIFSPPPTIEAGPSSSRDHRRMPGSFDTGPFASGPSSSSSSRPGLGGGLLSFRSHARPTTHHSQDNAAARQQAADRELVRAARRAHHAARRRYISRAIDIVMGERDFRGDYPLPPPQYLDAEEHHVQHHGFGFIDQFRPVRWIQDLIAPGPPEVPPPRREEDAYHHTMTHPADKPRPGYTFDFDPQLTSASDPIVIDDDEPGSSKASATASKQSEQENTTEVVLICAQCIGPLVLGSRSMWGLRCGHVVCRSCIEKMTIPTPPPVTDGKGKGKAKDEDVSIDLLGGLKEENQIHTTEHVANSTQPSEQSGFGTFSWKAESQDESALVATSSKGKGKARSTRSRKAAVPASTRQLRPRTAQLGSAALDADLSFDTDDMPPRGRKRNHRGATVTKPGTIAEEHKYTCPVSGCGKAHWSVRVWSLKKDRSGGSFTIDQVQNEEEWGEWVWKQKDGVGAIAIFT